MNTSLLETARSNRIAALEYLRIKKLATANAGQMYCLQTMREKMEAKPIFRTVRVHRLEEQLAA